MQIDSLPREILKLICDYLLLSNKGKSHPPSRKPLCGETYRRAQSTQALGCQNPMPFRDVDPRMDLASSAGDLLRDMPGSRGQDNITRSKAQIMVWGLGPSHSLSECLLMEIPELITCM